MIFMNFFILCELHPSVIYKWFMEVVAIDAYDWVMASNVYGMGFFDNIAMRKPYLSSSAYILRMSNYKKNGYWDTLWTALFYRFITVKPKHYVVFYKRLLKHTKNIDIAEAFLKAQVVKT